MLTDLKFKNSDFTGKSISDLSDTPSSDGMSAATLKEYFDYIPKAMIALGAVNSIIDLLVSSEGAENIGAGVTGLAGTDVAQLIESLKVLVDDRYTKLETNTLLATKAEQSDLVNSIKNVTFDSDTGKFVFTKQGGGTITIDTALEKVVTNFRYDSGTQSLILTLADGTTQTIALSEFITVNEFQDSERIDFNVEDGVVTADIKDGSVTDTKLSSAIIARITEMASNATNAAQSAAASEGNARTYSDTASAGATTATVAADNASGSAQTASSASSAAAASKSDAEAWAVGKRNGVDVGESDPAYHNNAKYYKEQAGQIVGEGFVYSVNSIKPDANGNVKLTIPSKLKDLSADSTHRTVTDTEKATWNNKASKATVQAYTLLASGWSGSTYDLGNTDSDLEIELDSSATDEMLEAWSAAKVVGSATSNVLTARGDIPTIDINCILKRTVK